MELYKEIICKELGEIIFETLRLSEIDYTEIVKLKSIEALQKIKAVIFNDSLSDFECVEEIVYIFETLGSDGGTRHDVG